MARYDLEQRAELVAEWILTGNTSRAARLLGVQRATARGWISAASRPLDDADRELADRAQEIAQAKRTNLDALYSRALKLQYRNLPDASFRDVTGLVKIIGDQRLLSAGQPTSIVEHAESAARIEAEVDRLAREVARRASVDTGP